MNNRLLQAVSYLFEDVEQEMRPVIATDLQINRLKQRITELEAKIVDRNARSEEIQRMLAEEDARIDELEQELIRLRRQRGSTMGSLATISRQNVTDRRCVQEIERQITRREDAIVEKEATRRLNALGKDLRNSKGTKIPKLGGGYVLIRHGRKYDDQDIQTSKRDLLRQAEGQETLQPENLRPEGGEGTSQPTV